MRNIPTVTKNLLIINVIAYLAYEVLRRTGVDLNDLFGLHFFVAKDFHLYQLFTYMFMHGGWDHIFFNMFALWMFGCVVENVWGPKKFLFYYILCGIGAGLCQELAQYTHYIIEGYANRPYIPVSDGSSIAMMSTADLLNRWTTVGASGAIYAILLAFGMIFPEERIFIFPLPIPIKAKWLVIIYAGVELFSAFGTSNDGVAHLAHLGGMLFGFILIKYWKKHPYSGFGDYGISKGQQFFDNLRTNWEQRSNRSATSNHRHAEQPRRESDWDYNARKQAEQNEIDRILDKIRKSGYDSLSKDEKQRLFDSSNKK
ncbi:MAG: rhomboid family intramembrane serine protease [Prevotella sp.]|nr:rhomboid family intramembrane serine protease [Prevotella sp.]